MSMKEDVRQQIARLGNIEIQAPSSVGASQSAAPHGAIAAPHGAVAAPHGAIAAPHGAVAWPFGGAAKPTL